MHQFDVVSNKVNKQIIELAKTNNVSQWHLYHYRQITTAMLVFTEPQEIAKIEVPGFFQEHSVRRIHNLSLHYRQWLHVICKHLQCSVTATRKEWLALLTGFVLFVHCLWRPCAFCTLCVVHVTADDIKFWTKVIIKITVRVVSFSLLGSRKSNCCHEIPVCHSQYSVQYW